MRLLGGRFSCTREDLCDFVQQGDETTDTSTTRTGEGCNPTWKEALAFVFIGRQLMRRLEGERAFSHSCHPCNSVQTRLSPGEFAHEVAQQIFSTEKASGTWRHEEYRVKSLGRQSFSQAIHIVGLIAA